MDSGKLKIPSKVAASTILEVLIAMVMIMVVFTIAMMIYANVMKASLSVKKIQAAAILNEAMQAVEKNKNPSSDSFTAGDLKIDQTVKPYSNEKNLLEIDLTAYDPNGDKITELHKLIITHE